MSAERKEDTMDQGQLRQKPANLATSSSQRPRSTDPNPEDLDQALCLLSKTKISERRPRCNTGNVQVTKENSIIVAKQNDTLSTIMEITSVESILGMGVIDTDHDNRCIGMVDVPDIARYLFFNCLKDIRQENLADLSAECCTKVQECMNKTTVQEVIRWLDQNHCCPLDKKSTVNQVTLPRSGPNENPHINPFCCSMIIPDGHSLLFGMEMMCHSGVKRLVTVDNAQRCTGFYSTSMAISDIRQQAHLLRSFTQCSVAQCLEICRTARQDTAEEDSMTDGTYNVTSLPITATAFEAFQLMLRKNITGIALLDTHGKLTGTISIRDLRGLGRKFENLDRLSLSLKDFKALTLREYPQIAPSTHWASDSKVPSGCRFVELGRGTMRDVLLALNDGNLNRVMIMDDAGTLCGIITLHDVIRCLLVCIGVLE